MAKPRKRGPKLKLTDDDPSMVAEEVDRLMAEVGSKDWLRVHKMRARRIVNEMDAERFIDVFGVTGVEVKKELPPERMPGEDAFDVANRARIVTEVKKLIDAVPTDYLINIISRLRERAVPVLLGVRSVHRERRESNPEVRVVNNDAAPITNVRPHRKRRRHAARG